MGAGDADGKDLSGTPTIIPRPQRLLATSFKHNINLSKRLKILGQFHRK